MKKILKVILVLLMICGSSLFGVGLFFEKVYEKTILKEAINQLDMVEIVKDEMGERYEMIGELLDTDEFKDILSSYSDGFINYILEGKDEMTISKEQISRLFTNYSSILLKEYPELSFLPTEKFVNFLVESVDMRNFLPTYEKMMTYVPQKVLWVMKTVHSPLWMAGSLALTLFSWIIYLVLDKKGAMLFVGGTLVFSGVAFVMIALNGASIFEWIDLNKYDLMKPALIFMCTYFKPIGNVYVFVGMVMMGIGLLMKGRKA